MNKLYRLLPIFIILAPSLLFAATEPTAPVVTFNTGSSTEFGRSDIFAALKISTIMTAMVFLPSVLMAVTCFPRISIILSITRQALGTAIETRLIGKVVMMALELLKDAWAPIHPVDFVYVRSEFNPLAIAIVPPTDVVIIVTVEVELEQESTTLTLCTPYSSFDSGIFSTLYFTLTKYHNIST